MTKKKFYIAHRITQRHYIRDVACVKLRKAGITPLNPFYKADGNPRKARLDISRIDSGDVNPYKEVKDFEDSNDIVCRDLGLIDQSNGVICFLPGASIGSSMEIFYCAHVLGKPVYVVTERYSGHPWLINYTSITEGFIVPSLSELLRRIEELK